MSNKTIDPRRPEQPIVVDSRAWTGDWENEREPERQREFERRLKRREAIQSYDLRYPFRMPVLLILTAAAIFYWQWSTLVVSNTKDAKDIFDAIMICATGLFLSILGLSALYLRWGKDPSGRKPSEP
jgi:hypothetical protein